MRKDNKRKNSILALFMSFAIAISGLGVPGISYVSAADEGNRSAVEKAVETPALEKASGMTDKEKTANAEMEKVPSSEKKEAWSAGDNPDHLKGPEKASPYPVILDSKADPYLGKEGKKKGAQIHIDFAHTRTRSRRANKEGRACAGQTEHLQGNSSYGSNGQRAEE